MAYPGFQGGGGGGGGGLRTGLIQKVRGGGLKDRPDTNSEGGGVQSMSGPIQKVGAL